MQAIDIFPWDDNFNTGIYIIDEQHKELVVLLNKLASHVAFHNDELQIASVFDELTNYIIFHFGTEEQIWHRADIGNELEEQHQKTHETFVNQVLEFRVKQETTAIDELADEMLGFLARWLATHILETDRYYAYLTRSIENGNTIKEAKKEAKQKMEGATRVLINIVLSIYETLSSNTLRLMREIAERKKREQQLLEAKIRAESGDLAKSNFIAAISHEVRTPLNVMLGMTQLMRQFPPTDEEREEYCSTIIDSGQSLLGLLNNIINLASIEAGKITFESKLFSLKTLLADLADEFTTYATQKGLKFTYQPTAFSDGSYIGDTDKIEQMLRHLFNNALKFTPHGAIELACHEISKSDTDTSFEFSVSDTGIGISSDAQSTIFAPFTQEDSSLSRKYEGAGLGLALVKNFSLLMGGDTGLSSSINQGTRIWFTIKLQRDIKQQ